MPSAAGLSGAAAAAGAVGAAGMVDISVGMTERNDDKSGAAAPAAAVEVVANGGGGDTATAAEGKVAVGRLPRDDGDGGAASGKTAGAGAVAADGSATVKAAAVDSVAAANGASSATKHDEWVRVPVRAIDALCFFTFTLLVSHARCIPVLLYVGLWFDRETLTGRRW
jgi:hypothetical protein